MPSSSSDDSMDEKERRFYSRATPAHQAPTSTSSSESEGGSPPHPRKNPNPNPNPNPKPLSTNRNVAAIPKPSNSKKRAREEEQSRGLEKKKKTKELKKPPPLEASKQSDEKTSEDKKRVERSESAKKNGLLWNAQDEISFLKGVVAYKAIKGMPKTNKTPLYLHIRKLTVLEHEYSNTQMYEKLRRLNIKFTGLKDKLNAGGFTFKTSHDEMIYKIGKQIWGNGEEEEDESTGEEAEKNGDEGVAEDEKKGEGQDVEMAHKEEEGLAREGNLASNGGAQKPSVVSDTVLNNGSSSIRGAGELIDLLHSKNLAMMNQIKDDLAREKEQIKKEIIEVASEVLRSSVSSGTSGSVLFSSEEIIKRISSSRELPALEKAEADRLQHKWQRQHLIELDVSSKHLLLLQEECQLRMEKIRSLLEGKNS